jgi:Pregnancy-associated plasma protein-A
MTNNIVIEQMKVLNDNYQNTPFRFQLMNATYIVNETYYNNMTESNQPAIGLLYKKGGTSTLMVYWGNNEEGGSYARSPGLLHVSEDDFVTDGAFMDINTVPGGSSECCNEGKTLAHEVGHWLGLYHTFNGDSCDTTNQGDFVSDTPQQASKTNFTCPIGRDSCPDLPGVDPIHNFMDYSNDPCLTEFTPRQIERMYIVWSLFRQSNDVCTSDQILFTMEIKLDSFSSETSWQLTGPDLFINPVKNGFANTGITADDTRETVIIDICLPINQTYNFTIFDSQSDGIDSPGYYKIYLAGALVKEGQKFGSSESTIINAISANVSHPTTRQPTIHTSYPSKNSTSPMKTPQPTPKAKAPTTKPTNKGTPKSITPTTKPTNKVTLSNGLTESPSIANLFLHSTSKPKKASMKGPNPN